MDDNENRKSVCIIGAGLAGLTCGMRLARAGFKVTVVEELASPDGRTFPGLGLLPGKAVMNTRIAALGYRSVEGAWGRLKGHEFHYASLAAEPPPPHLWQAADARGRRFACGGSRDRVRGSFIHLYFDSDPAFTERFCRELEM